MTIPRFAVVGHPNKGKSSIVATLARNDTVLINPVSGSTRHSTHYPMSIGGSVLYELVDTPGFQRARATLEWLNEHCNDASHRADTVKLFVETFQDDPIFQSEHELLAPLVAGAAIIYVVDGSRPYGREYEAEMEVLRWTGCPSMALINPIDNENYLKEWHNALNQYFQTVSVFNAHKAEFNKQIELLNIFSMLIEAWQSPLNRASQLLMDERKRQHEVAAETITTLIIDVLQFKKAQKIPDGVPLKPVKTTLEYEYKQALVQFEENARKTVEQLFSHTHIVKHEDKLAWEAIDLFDQQRWYLFGLNKKQLTVAAAGAGASAGALLDLGLGGSTFFMGTIVGGTAATIGALVFSEKIAQISIKGLPTGGQIVYCGPVRHGNFPFVVLGRALHHYQSISQRSHADRSVLQLENAHPLEHASSQSNTKLMQIFSAIKKGKNLQHQRQALYDTLLSLIAAMD